MEQTLVLVSGYWILSKDLLKQVDPDMPRDDRGVDYVIRVENLPQELIAVDEIDVIKYHCETCDKPVPEWEVENKTGCFLHHKCDRRITKKKNYQSGLMDIVPDEFAKKRPVMKDAIRIFLGNPQGRMLAERIFDYVKRTYSPLKRIPDPIAVGTKTGWTLEGKDTIPVWELPSMEAVDGKPAEETKKETMECPYCQKELKNDTRALRMHVRAVHPDIFKTKYEKSEEEKGAI